MKINFEFWMKLSATNKVLLILLLTPLFSYLYTFIFHLPKYFTFSFTFFVFFFCVIFFIKYFGKIKWPDFVIFSLVFAGYETVWHFFLVYGEYFDKRVFLTEIYHYIKYFTISFFVAVIYNTRFSKWFIRVSISIMKILVVITSIVSIAQLINPAFLVAGEEEKTIYENIYTIRRSSIYGFDIPGSLGLSFIPLLSVLIGYMNYTHQRYKYVFLILGGISAFLSNTRFVMVGFILVTFLVFLTGKDRVRGFFKYTFFIICGLFIFSYFFRFIGYDITDWFNDRLLVEGDIRYTTRYLAIFNFIRFFPESPFIGTGYLTDEIRIASNLVGSSHIHVGYLSHLVYYGIFGCFFLFGFWFLLLKRMYKTAKKTGYYGSIVGFVTYLFAFATMSQSVIFYAGIMFCFVFDKYFWDLRMRDRKVYKNKNIL